MDNPEKHTIFQDSVRKKKENLNRPITSKEVESVIKNSQHRKIQVQIASQVNSTKNSKSQYLYYSKKLKRKEYLLVHFIRPALRGTKTIQRHYKKKRKLQANFPDKHKYKNL